MWEDRITFRKVADMNKCGSVGEHYDFAVSEDIAKKKPWSLIKDGDTFPVDGGVVRAYVLPHGVAFRVESKPE